MPGDDDAVLRSEGEAQRAAAYATALVGILRRDPRVEDVYRLWLFRHGLDADPVPTYRPHPADQTDARRLVETLGITCPALPRLLLIDFRARFLLDFRVALTAPDASTMPDLPPGHRPKGGGDYLERDVEWYYRARVQQPADTVYGIAKEYERGQQRAGLRGLGTVHAAIKRVERLLAMLADSDDDRR